MITEQDKLKLMRISKIINQLCEIVSTQKETITSRIYWYAIARGLEIIVETTKNISSIARKSHSDFPWFTVEHLRDLLNHGHFKMEKGKKPIELKEKIISDINILKGMISTMLDDKIEAEIPEKKKEKSEKTDARSAREKLLEEKDKSLSGFREAGLYLDLSKENTQLTVGDLQVLKSRMRRPTFYLLLIQTETQFILNCLDQRKTIKDDDILQLIFEHSLGIIGQSMKEFRGYHTDFVKMALLEKDFEHFIELRNDLLHSDNKSDNKIADYTLSDLLSETPSIQQLGINLVEIIKKRDTTMDKITTRIPTTKSDFSAEVVIEHKQDKLENETFFGMDFDNDLFEEKKPKGSPHKWQYGYYSDDDKIAENFSHSSEYEYDETTADINEIEKIFEEERERKRAKPDKQLFTENKKNVEDVETSANSSSSSSSSYKPDILQFKK